MNARTGPQQFKIATSPHEDPSQTRLALGFGAGGALGAAQYGALHALHQRGLFKGKKIVALSGNSAGAANATLLADGLAEPIPDIEAGLDRQAEFWARVANEGSHLTNYRRLFFGHNADSHNLSQAEIDNLSMMASWMHTLGISPNIANRDRIANLVDWDRLNHSAVRLFVGALVEVAAGRREERIFRNGEHSPDTIAAACALFSAHEIKGRSFWDGALSKALPVQVMEEVGFTDLIVFGEGPPNGQVLHPIHQALLVKELGLPHASQLIAPHLAFLAGHKPYRLHFVEFKVEEAEATRGNYEKNNILRLIRIGQEQADAWFDRNAHLIGVQSSFDAKRYNIAEITDDRRIALG